MDSERNRDETVGWRSVMDQLAAGKAVTIPCQFERDFVRRAAQAAKRANRANLTVEIIREDASLRLVPRPRDRDVTAAGEGAGKRFAESDSEPNTGSSPRRERRRRAKVQ